MDTETQVHDNPAQQRYELAVGNDMAFVDYERHGSVRVLTHAEVPPALRGGGVGRRLVAGTLDLVRSSGEKVVPRCSYVAAFIARNRQYMDLVAN